MHIWLIQTGEQLPVNANIRKMRTAILADKLIEKGHTVCWWASAFDHLKKTWVFKKDCEIELKRGLKINVLKGIGYKKNISIRRFIDYKIVARKFKKRIYKEKLPDLIITSMPSYDLAYNAVGHAKEKNIKVIVDIRDQWPDIFLNYFPSKLQWLPRMILYKDFIKVKKIMSKSDGLIAMMDILLNWGLKYAQRKKTWKDQVFYLGCKKLDESNYNCEKIQRLLIKIKNKFVVLFIGTFATFHNPTVLVDCAAKLVNNDIIFVLAGSGELFNQIEKKAVSLPNVILTGWLDQKEISALLKCSHVGVCPTPRKHNIAFLPNKAFMYFSAGLPILTAFDGPIRNIVEKHKIGFYYEPQDVVGLVEKIKILHENFLLYNSMSQNALRVFNDMFDADNIYKKYVDHIESIINDKQNKKLEVL